MYVYTCADVFICGTECVRPCVYMHRTVHKSCYFVLAAVFKIPTPTFLAFFKTPNTGTLLNTTLTTCLISDPRRGCFMGFSSSFFFLFFSFLFFSATILSGPYLWNRHSLLCTIFPSTHYLDIRNKYIGI